MKKTNILEAVLMRDHWIVIAAIGAVILLSWLYLLMGAGLDSTAYETNEMGMSSTMGNMEMTMLEISIWTPRYALFMFLMWWVMMIAMMIPGATPMILLFAALNRQRDSKNSPYMSTAVFVLAYILVWGVFSLLVTGAQWGLERSQILSSMLPVKAGFFAAMILIVAGIYQLTPLKHACLRQCRSPIQFITRHMRAGVSGAFQMGIKHGTFCLGCCWTLMALLFVGGVMNLYWILGLAIFILLEKCIPAGHKIARLGGVGLTVWGGWMLLAAVTH